MTIHRARSFTKDYKRLSQNVLSSLKQVDKSLSGLVNKLLDRIFVKREEIKVQQMYTVLEELKGLGGEGIEDASSTIDEVLYGENGAWRGSKK